jgi:hypothetical protein
MLQSCSSDAALEGLLDETINKVRKTLFPQASLSTQSRRFQASGHTEDDTAYFVLLETPQRIVQKPEAVVRALTGTPPGGILRGVSLHDFGKIILSENQWCIETLVHETLHRLSIFALRGDLNQRYRLMIEGLTECLTEYLLSKHFVSTYNDCLRANGTYCSLTYRYETAIWCAMASVVGYSIIVPIYFWHGRTDWESLFDDLVLSVRRAGYPRFANILKTPGKLPVMTRFHQECGRRLGEKYSAAYREVSDRYAFR